MSVTAVEAMAAGMPRRFDVGDAEPSFARALELNPASREVWSLFWAARLRACVPACSLCGLHIVLTVGLCCAVRCT